MTKKTTKANDNAKNLEADAVEVDAIDVEEIVVEEVFAENQNQNQDDGSMLRKKEIVEQVVQMTGIRKREVREAFEAIMSVFHENLLNGLDIQCAPLGKIKVKNQSPDDEEPKLVYRVILKKVQNEADIVEEINDDE